jgi:hypothetical protein
MPSWTKSSLRIFGNVTAYLTSIVGISHRHRSVIQHQIVTEHGVKKTTEAYLFNLAPT